MQWAHAAHLTVRVARSRSDIHTLRCSAGRTCSFGNGGHSSSGSSPCVFLFAMHYHMRRHSVTNAGQIFLSSSAWM